MKLQIVKKDTPEKEQQLGLEIVKQQNKNSVDKYLDDVCSVVFHDVLFKNLCLVKIEYFLFFYFKDKDHFLISEKSLHKRVFLLARKLNSWKRTNISYS